MAISLASVKAALTAKGHTFTVVTPNNLSFANHQALLTALKNERTAAGVTCTGYNSSGYSTINKSLNGYNSLVSAIPPFKCQCENESPPCYPHEYYCTCDNLSATCSCNGVCSSHVDACSCHSQSCSCVEFSCPTNQQCGCESDFPECPTYVGCGGQCDCEFYAGCSGDCNCDYYTGCSSDLQCSCYSVSCVCDSQSACTSYVAGCTQYGYVCSCNSRDYSICPCNSLYAA